MVMQFFLLVKLEDMFTILNNPNLKAYNTFKILNLKKIHLNVFTWKYIEFMDFQIELSIVHFGAP
jgi:hypothetical protein